MTWFARTSSRHGPIRLGILAPMSSFPASPRPDDLVPPFRPDPPTLPAVAVFTDVRINRRSLYNLSLPVAALLLILCIGLLLLVASWLQRPWIRWGLAFVCMVVVPLLDARRRAVRARVRAALSSCPDAPPGIWADLALESYHRAGPMLGVHALAACLAEAGRFGYAFRFCADPPDGNMEPIVVPFEPQPLDEADAGVRALAGLGSADAPLPPFTADRGTDCPRPQAFWRLRRLARVIGGWGVLAVLVSINVLALVVALKVLVLLRRDNVALALCVAWTLVAVIAQAIAFVVGSLREWLAVPGGLVMRKTNLLRARWDVSFFDRRKTVVCIYPAERTAWRLLVADGRKVYTAEVTQFEAEFALRAWLSPLPPPSPDQLTDLQ